MKAPENFPILAMTMRPKASSARCGIAQNGDVGVQPGEREEYRHEQRNDEAAELFVDVAGEDRRFADQDAGDEGAEHGIDAEQLRGQRHRAHDDQEWR